MKAAVLSMVLLAMSGFEPHGGQTGSWWRLEPVLREIGLQEQQIQQIEKLVLDQRRAAIDLRAEVEKKRLDFQEAVDADVPDEARVLTLFDQVQAARVQLEKSELMTRLKVRKLLTPEQFDKLRARFGALRGGGPRGDGWAPAPPEPPQPPNRPPRAPRAPMPPEPGDEGSL